MRPFYKIDDEGLSSYDPEDQLCYFENPDLYDELYDRGDLLIEEAFKKHMGSFYEKKPLPLFKELKQEYDNRLEKKARMEKLNAPTPIIENEERLITELHFKMKNKKFATLNDSAQSKYREEYNKREESFYKSTEFINLRKEIYAYNRSRWNEEKAND